MSSVLLDLLGELIRISGMVVSALFIRWLMGLSTPQKDWRTVQQAGDWLYDSIRIPDWREHFNMDRLRRMREHPDVASVVDGTLVVQNTEPSISIHTANDAVVEITGVQ